MRLPGRVGGGPMMPASAKRAPESRIVRATPCAVLGATAIVNSYLWPPRVAERYAVENHITIPPGVENRDGTYICMAGKRS